MAAALLPQDATDGVRLKVKCSLCLLKHEPNGCVALVGAADDLDPFVARCLQVLVDEEKRRILLTNGFNPLAAAETYQENSIFDIEKCKQL